MIDATVASADRHGRGRDGISCEVLSTMPLPLQCVLARHQLGRWRVLQKANLDDPGDVYRPENAVDQDWVMIGNHDTPSIFGLHASWDEAKRERWAEHLVARLGLAPEARAALAGDPGLFASAMLAELFACRAENVMIFFADLFGYERQFNVPGTVAETNWSMRLPSWFAERYRDRLAQSRALNLPLALALALAARGSPSTALIARLWEVAGAGTRLRAAESPG
jgi:4-alpha-glucanotransferase